MSGLMICTMDHYAGDVWVRKGTIGPADTPGLVPLYWVPFDVDDGKPAPKKVTKR